MYSTDQFKVLAFIQANKDLNNFFNYYINNCITLTNPYHNANHTISMMYHIIEIYEHSNNNEYDFKLDNTQLYILLLSAMFHDYNHSGYMYDDIINVDNAIDSLKNIITKMFPNDIELADGLKIECENVIKATCYPYIIEDNQLTLLQRIIRECDILVCLSNDVFTQSMLGLKTEMKEHDWSSFLSKYAKFQISSMKDLKLEYSKEVIANNLENFLAHLDLLYNIINNK